MKGSYHKNKGQIKQGLTFIFNEWTVELNTDLSKAWVAVSWERIRYLKKEWRILPAMEVLTTGLPEKSLKYNSGQKIFQSRIFLFTY